MLELGRRGKVCGTRCAYGHFDSQAGLDARREDIDTDMDIDMDTDMEPPASCMQEKIVKTSHEVCPRALHRKALVCGYP